MGFSSERGRWFVRRAIWLPTWRTATIAAVLFIGLGILCASRLHPFLAFDRRVPATIMVVEGWLPEYALQAAAEEFAAGDYDLLVTSGGPLPEGFRISGYASYADFSAAILVKLGFPPDHLVSVPAAATFRHRTYHGAVAVREFLDRNRDSTGTGREIESGIAGMNVVTLGTHGRRTWIVFRKVMEPAASVGIISVPSDDYDPSGWWRSSEGVKTVMTEGLGWFYEKFLDSMRDVSDGASDR